LLSARQILAAPKETLTGSLKNTPGLKPKDLVGIPWRVAFALQADGWWLRQDIIWSKSNPMPESVTDRCTKAHEYLFLLSKSERYYYDADAIAEASCAGYNGSAFDKGKTLAHQKFETGKGERPQQRRARELADKAGLTQKHIAAIRAVGVTDAGKAQTTQHGFGRNTENVIRLAAEAKAALGGYYREFLIADTRNKRSVWEIPTAPFPEAHFATFPPALIEPCILAGCPKEGTVLDPFGGAGTTGLVADRLGRNAILIELNPEYAEMAERRIKKDAGMFADVQV
jgi:site-specific DNA-methyltransferase (cytosine-N4-specific)